MISILLPTRGRPESFKKVCLAALDNATNPDDIEFVSYHDNDDPAVYEYVGNHKEVVGERIIQSKMYDECLKLATGPIYLWFVDDVLFLTKDWDMEVKKAFDKSDDKIIFVYPNDGHHGANFGVVGFVHKNWIDTVGYFLPPYFPAFYADKWMNELGDRINRKVFLENVKIKNLIILDDQTHKEYEVKINISKQIYHSREKKTERMMDARLLQSFIDNFKRDKISICVPTRGRPEPFKQMCLSVLDNATNPDDIEFVSYHDNDDPAVYEYVGNHKEVVGERIIQSKMFNECYKTATGPIYMFMVDDVLFDSKGWDTLVREAFEKSTDKILFAYPNDGIGRHAGFGAVGFLHKNWIDTVGYFLPPYFSAWYSDNWINALAGRVDRKVFLEGMKLKFLLGIENQNITEHMEKIKSSKQIYYSREKKTQRENDAQLLLKFIENHG